MNDLESQFKMQAQMVRVMPHDRAWERIEAKLQVHHSRRKLFSARLWNIAAAVLLLTVVSTGIFLYFRYENVLSAQQYSTMLEELTIQTPAQESMFDIENIRKSYADLKY